MGVHEFGKFPAGSHFEKREPAEKEYISFRDVFSFLRRNLWTVGIFAVIGLALGTFYVIKTPPSYVATARLVMDPEQGKIVSQDPSSGTVIIEAAEIASQVEIVKSESVAQAVIRQLDLTKDPEILNDQSWRSVVREFFMSGIDLITGASDVKTARPISEEEMMRRTMGGFLSRVTVQRVGQSYVLQIGYRSHDPRKAARITNALAAAYIHNGMAERADAAKLGAIWLQSRLAEVGRKARQAALAAEEFRNKNGIASVGNSSTLDQQQLSELSNQLLAAKAAVAAESAKLTTVIKVINGQAPDDSVDQTANNTQLQKLREDIRTTQTRLSNLKSRYDEGNPAIVAAEAEIARLQEAINDEYRRIEAVYRTDLQVAQTRESLVESQFVAASKTGEEKNIARVDLSELESRANTYRRLYENVLQQLSNTLQTLSFPLGKARIVTAATAPFAKTWPKTSVILPFSMALGLAIGLMVAILRSELDRRTSSSQRLQRELGINSLGRLPVFKTRLQGDKGKPTLSAAIQPLRSILDAPYSQFSESLRGVKNSLDATIPASGSLVIGITSVGAGEGKTTVAANLAQLYQNEGQSILLVDADFVSARLTRLANTSSASDLGIVPLDLSEVIGSSITPTRPKPASQVVQPDNANTGKAKAQTGADQPVKKATFVPVPLLTTEEIKKIAASHQRYGHLPALREAIGKLRQHYRVIILDMSGFENSADTRAICTYLDGVILVLGNTNKMTIDRLADALKSFGRSRFALLGVIANRSSARHPHSVHEYVGVDQ